MRRIKQVILIRKDLKMRRGKEIAQGSHASMDFIVSSLRPQLSAAAEGPLTIQLSAEERIWLREGMAKVCLRVASEEDLLHYHNLARREGLRSHLIQDSGRTEFHGQPTYTACAIGPEESDKIDVLTGELEPY